MSSTLTFKKQIPSDTPYFIAISSFVKKTLIKNNTSTGNYGPGTLIDFSNAGITTDASQVPMGSIMRDLGKTVVSAGRAFRYVQLIEPNLTATGSVAIGGKSQNGIVGSATGISVTANTSIPRPAGTADTQWKCFYAEVPLNGMCPGALGASSTLIGNNNIGAPDPIVRYG